MAAESLVHACRIGETTVLIALPGGADSETLTIETNGREPVRIFSSSVAARKLVVAQFGAAGMDGGAITLHLGGGPVTVSADQPLQAFIGQLGFGLEQAAALLFLLAGTVSKLFRLHHDKLLTAALREVSRALPVPQVTMEILCIAGVPDCVIRYSHQARLPPDAMLLAFADGNSGPQRHELRLKGSRLVQPYRIAHAVLPRPAAELTGILAVDQGRLMWFNLVTDTSSSVAQFHRHAYAAGARGGGAADASCAARVAARLVAVESQDTAAKCAAVDAGLRLSLLGGGGASVR